MARGALLTPTGGSGRAIDTSKERSQDAISRIERGAEAPTLERLAQLLLALGSRPVLARHDVDCVVIGGMATQVHGHRRTLGVAKPDATVFQHALSQLGVDSDRAVMVGDSISKDVDGALAAGLGAVWVNRSGRSSPPNRTDLVEISTLSDLPRALGSSGLQGR